MSKRKLSFQRVIQFHIINSEFQYSITLRKLQSKFCHVILFYNLVEKWAEILILDFVYFLVFQIENTITVTGCVSIPRWNSRDAHIQLCPLKVATPSHWTIYLFVWGWQQIQFSEHMCTFRILENWQSSETW
jgi:hypothetical protein